MDQQGRVDEAADDTRRPGYPHCQGPTRQKERSAETNTVSADAVDKQALLMFRPALSPGAIHIHEHRGKIRRRPPCLGLVVQPNPRREAIFLLAYPEFRLRAFNEGVESLGQFDEAIDEDECVRYFSSESDGSPTALAAALLTDLLPRAEKSSSPG